MIFKVMTFNIQHGKGLDQSIDLDRQAAIIRKSGADIVFLQEVDKALQRSYGLDEAQVLSNKSGLEHYVYGKNLDYGEGEYGNAILSRFQLSQQHNHSLPHPLPARERSEPRGLLQVQAMIDGVGHQLLNTHFSLYAEERLIEVDAVLKTIDQIPAVTPIIFGGDLNAYETSKEVLTLSQHLTDTYQSVNHNTPSDKRIDYIFFRGPYQITNFAEIPTNASDHNPLVATCSLQISGRV